MNTDRNAKRMLLAIYLLLGLIPLAVYGLALGRAPQVHAAQAVAMLEDPGRPAVLVDVRPAAAYQQRHIAESVSLPLEQILAVGSLSSDLTPALPPELRGRTLLLVCDAGVMSAQAARHLAGLGAEAYSVRGGMQDWGRAWPGAQDSPFSRFVLAGGVAQEPFKAMSMAEQAAASLALLWIKPLYMLLSGLVAGVLLLRVKAGDLRLLGWGLLVFLVGEIFCALNYIALQDNSYFSEYMHSYSMAMAFGLVAYALMDGLDERLLHFSRADKPCALLPVCGPCSKYRWVRCGMRRMAQLAGLAVIVLAFIPLLAPFDYTAYNTRIAMFTHYYVRPLVHQWFEARYSPLIALALSGAALLVMLITPKVSIHPLARALFCAGLGFFGFALFRVTLGLLYADALIWAVFWEELTELMFVLAVMYVLWVFRRTLLKGVTVPEALQLPR